MTKKIIDNPSLKDLHQVTNFFKNTFNLLDKIPLVYSFSKLQKFRNEFKKVELLMPDFNLPDQFNSYFAKDGWICFSSMSQEILNQSVQLAVENKIPEAKELLISSIDEKFINHILLKCKTRDHFQLRLTLLELIKEDYLANRFHSCTPLLLALIDGLANDISKHIGFFTEGLNLNLFDSITAHSSGLPFLKEIMNSPRKNTNTDEVFIPYRNGIIHGRDLNFANKEVASKCWWALAALIDWADDLSRPASLKNESLSESLDSLIKTNQMSKRISSWKKRPQFNNDYSTALSCEEVIETSPEYTLQSFLNSWKKKQWGLVYNFLIHTINNSSIKISDIKKDLSPITILNYSILQFDDQTPAITLVDIHIEYIKLEKRYSKHISVSMNYLNTKGHLLLRDEPEGCWKVSQLSFSEILF